MAVDLQIGTITGVSIKDNMITVNHSGTPLTIPLDSSLSVQEMPTVGSLVLFMQHGQHVIKIVKIWQNTQELLRGGSGPMLPGEVQYQSAGKGYIYLNNDGDVSIVDGGMRNNIRISKKDNEVVVEGSNIKLRNMNGTEMSILEDGTFSVIQSDSNGNEVASIALTKDGTIEIFSNNLILNNDKFYIQDIGDIRLSGSEGIVVAPLIPPGTSIPPTTPLKVSSKMKGG